MKSTRYDGPFDTRASEWIGDLTVWTRQNAGDNSERLERLRRNLRQARERELTPRQRQMLELYYDHGMTIPQIAGELGLNPPPGPGPALPVPALRFVDFPRENPGFSCRFVHSAPLFPLRFPFEAAIIIASVSKKINDHSRPAKHRGAGGNPAVPPDREERYEGHDV